MVSGTGVVGRKRDTFWEACVPEANALVVYHSTVRRARTTLSRILILSLIAVIRVENSAEANIKEEKLDLGLRDGITNSRLLVV